MSIRIKISILIVTLIALGSIAFNCNADISEKDFNSANQLYRAGQYNEAAKKFEVIIKNGFKSATVYYNLGNSYYKTQNFSKAILNYERAKRMDPFDEDISYNLKLAYANTVDKIEPVPQLFYERWWDGLIMHFSTGTWSLIAITLLWITTGLGIWYLFANSFVTKKISFYSASLFLVFSLSLFFIASCSHKRMHEQKTAIVMDPNAYVKSSPDSKSTNLFMLHEGTRIDVVDELSGWKQIRIANGNIGWIETNSIEII